MAFLKCEDYVICIVTLMFSLGIGLYYSLRDSKSKTTKYFLIGDGNMAISPVALSMMVSFESGIMMLSIPAEVYMYGMQWYISIIAMFVSNMLVMHLIIPTQRKLNITSLTQTNYLGNVVFVPAVTLEIVTGIPVWISIFTLMGVVAAYTIIGGFRAVVWTDVFQTLFMYGGMLAVLIKGTMETGGITQTWNIFRDKGRFNMLNFDPDPTLRQSFWSLVVGGATLGLELCFSQQTFQRIKATRTVSTSKRMFILAMILSLTISGLAVLEGGVMFAFYHVKGCYPLKAKQVTNQNQYSVINPEWSVRHFLGGYCEASYQTDVRKTSCINYTDLGGIAVCFAFGISGIQGPVSWIVDITGSSLAGTLMGLFLLGWFVPRANALGALIGGLAGFCFIGWISIGKLVSSGLRANVKLESASVERCPFFNISLSNDTLYSTIVNTTTMASFEPQGLDVLYSLSYKWLVPIGIVLVLIVGSLASCLQAPTPVDPSLYVPVCEYLDHNICLPIRQKCGVKSSYNNYEMPGDRDKHEEVPTDAITSTHKSTTVS